jgi:hypothetical protein
MSVTRAVAGIAAIAALAACQQADQPSVQPSPAPSPRVSLDAELHRAEAWHRGVCNLPGRYLELIQRGDYRTRSPELALVPRAPNYFGSFSLTSHSGPWRYLQNVPLVLYGPGFIRARGELDLRREVTSADLAPTLAELLEVDWPGGRPGAPITEALVPASRQPGRPRLVLVVVWDGGGWNVLKHWPGHWPFLRSLMHRGTSVENVAVGSSPSVTPAIHATIGTGAWPDQHGIVDLQLRDQERVIGAFQGENPAHLKLTTLADIYDPTTGNAAKVGMLAERNWHMGMVGHGAQVPGGDRDIMVLGNGIEEDLYTNEKWFTLPDYLDEVAGLDGDVRIIDLEDGRLDETWSSRAILGDLEKLRLSPVQTLYQTRQLTTLLAREEFGLDDVPDLFYTNFKQIDLAGHLYNLASPEMGSSLEHADASLERLAAWLNGYVGRGRWVIAMTADHGQGPDARAAGAWPINKEELEADAAAHFAVKPGDLFQKTRITGFWLNLQGMRSHGITVDALANWLSGYRLRANVSSGREIPSGYGDRSTEKLFSAVFPYSIVPEIAAFKRAACA